MADPFDHLSANAREALALPIDDRIRFLQQGWWIGYPRAKALLGELESILSRPTIAREPCMMIVGPSNNGKTVLLRRFKKMHLPVDHPERGLEMPVLAIEDMKAPDERAFYNAIIDATGLPNRPHDPIAKLEYKAHRLLINLHVRMLIIDEFNVFANGSPREQRNMLNILKTLSTRRSISIVAAGTREALQLMQLDAQFSNRFRPSALPIWTMGPTWQALLASFETLLPLPSPSNLAEPRTAEFLLTQSEGTIGELWTLLTELAVHAFRKGKSQITREMVAEIAWAKPSQRVSGALSNVAWAQI
jgi:hypothetical protein